MADVHHFLLVVMVMVSLSAVQSHECDCSKDAKGEDGCSQYTAAVRDCIEPIRARPSYVDIPTICRIYNQTVACMATAPTCDNPPADSGLWTSIWADMKNLAGPICSKNPDDTSCGNFESQALTCVLDMANGRMEADVEEMCRLYKDAKACMDPLVSRCPAEAQTSNNYQGWQVLKKPMESIPC